MNGDREGMPGGSEAMDTASSAGDTARDASSDAIGWAAEAARRASGKARAQAGTLFDQANEHAEAFLRDQIRFGADLAKEGADAARAFAEDIDKRSPHVADQVRTAADAIEDISRRAHSMEPRELFDLANDFARRQPLVFAGAALAAGFAAARFFRSVARSGRAAGATKARGPASGSSSNDA